MIIKARQILFSSLFTLVALSCGETNPSTYSSEKQVEGSQIAWEVSFHELNSENGLLYYNGALFSGVATLEYSNGKTAEKINYLEGERHGLQQKYFNNGMLSFQAEFAKGKRHGITTSWWKNGNKRSESYFENGLGQGSQYQWYRSGAKFKEIRLVDGKENGMQRSWRENGKLYDNYEAKNGRIYGLKRATLCFQLDDEDVAVSNR